MPGLQTLRFLRLGHHPQRGRLEDCPAVEEGGVSLPLRRSRQTRSLFVPPLCQQAEGCAERRHRED